MDEQIGDRMVKINGISLMVHDDFRSNRRNTICHSNTLAKYIEDKKKKKKDGRSFILQEFIQANKDKLDDIEVVGIDGFY